jgi:uncharacterized protein YlxW (UPF0749 family)
MVNEAWSIAGMGRKVFFMVIGTLFLACPWVAAEETGAQKTSEQFAEEVKTLTQDRDNILKQAQAIQKEKGELQARVEELKKLTGDVDVERKSLKKEKFKKTSNEPYIDN